MNQTSLSDADTVPKKRSETGKTEVHKREGRRRKRRRRKRRGRRKGTKKEKWYENRGEWRRMEENGREWRR